VRDLPPAYTYDIVAGRDGSVWIHRHKRLVRLGDRSFELPTNGSGGDLEVAFTTAADGTVWLQQGNRLYSDDDGAWTVRRKSVAWFTIAPDGTVWAAQSRREPFGLDLARLGADGWEPLGEQLLYPGWPLAADGGEAWAVVSDAAGRSIRRHREDGGAWHEVTTLPRPAYINELDDFVYGVSDRPVVGSDGTFWFAYAEPLMIDGELVLDDDAPDPDKAALGESFLMRFGDNGWQLWGAAEGVPSMSASILIPAPDGGLWVRHNHRWWGPGVDGIFRFDGSTWRHFLPGHSFKSVSVAPDGSVWLLADGIYDGIYVITPEAIAASE
jgi:hypothetical protein